MEEAFSSDELIVPKKRTGPCRTDTFRIKKNPGDRELMTERSGLCGKETLEIG